MEKIRMSVVSCLLGMVSCWAMSSQAEVFTRTFQNGVDGYVGAEDTHLNRHSTNNTNYGASTTINVLGALGDNGWSGLLRFNNLFGDGENQIPPDAVIVSAQLKLTAHTRYQDIANQYVSIWPMIKDWTAGTMSGGEQEGSSCINARHYRPDGDYAGHPDDAWGTGGVIRLGPERAVDFENNYVAHCYINTTVGVNDTTEQVMTFNLSTTVRNWQANPSGNFGVFIITSGSWSKTLFHSSDAAVVSKRPQLVVEYIEAEEWIPQRTVAQYSMDRLLTDGATVEDISGHGHNLVFTPAMTLSADDPFTNGYSQSIYMGYTGSANMASATSPETINLSENGTTTFTMEGWFKPTSTTAGVGLMHFSSNDGGLTHIIVRTDTDSRIRVRSYFKGGTWQNLYSLSTLPLNQWTHIAVVQDANRVQTLYVNGVSQGSVTQVNTLPANASFFYVGRTTDQVNQFIGCIDDVRLCNDALSPAQFSLIKNFTVVQPGGAIAQYRMDRLLGGTIVKDISGNGNDLVFSQAVTLDPDNPFNVNHSQSVCYRWTGGQTRGSVNNPAAINLSDHGTNTFTMEGWFKPTDDTRDNGLMQFNSTEGGTTNLIVRTNTDSKIRTRVCVKGTWAPEIISSTSLLQNQWTHVALVGEADGTLRLYINGVQEGQSMQTVALLPSIGTYFWVGQTSDQGRQFAGHIDDVQLTDDSLTPEQLGSHSTLTVTRTVYADAEEFGGFDPVNATTTLQNALNCDEAVKVIIPNKGTPWIVDPILIAHCADMDVEFEEGVSLIARPGSFHGSQDSLLLVFNVYNVNILGHGAVLQMQKQDYLDEENYTSSEHRHALLLAHGENVVIQDLTLKDTGGDGLSISADWARGLPSKNVHIKNVVTDNTYRQGISVTCVDGLLIEDCIVNGSSGTAPECGIDIEPSYDFEVIRDVILRNCVIANNAGQGIQFHLTNLTSEGINAVMATVENCTIYSNACSGIKLDNSIPHLIVKDNLVINNGEYGMEQAVTPAGSVSYTAFWGNTSGAVNSNVTLGTGSLTTVAPIFASTTLGDENFMCLSSASPAAIRLGASDGSVMGARPVVASTVLPGDANYDTHVDVGDLGILAANYGRNLQQEGVPQDQWWGFADFNNDGIVDVGDLGILAANYGTNASGADWATDYQAAFGMSVNKNDSETETFGNAICSGLGLPLIAGLALVGLMLVKLEE